MTQTKQDYTATPWEVIQEPSIYEETSFCVTGKILTVGNGMTKCDAEFIVKAVNSHEQLKSAVNKAIEMTLDSVVGQAIKDGTLLEEEMHAGLCLLGYIRRKALKTYEEALKKAGF